MSYFIIFISAVFVNNIVLSQFLGICPFLGVSKKLDTAVGMSAAVMGRVNPRAQVSIFFFYIVKYCLRSRI